MKVSKWVDMGAHVEVEIGADDIRAALSEAFERAMDRSEEPPVMHDIMVALNSIGAFLNGLEDSTINRFNARQRRLTSDFLAAAALRFSVTEP